MQPVDFAKAFGLAILLMVINVAAAFGVVAVYSYAVDPGHDAAYYDAAALSIAPWSSVAGGIVLFFIACFLAARRRPERNAFGFALASAASYIGIDAAVLLAAGAFQALGMVVPVSFGTKLAAALAGAWSGRPRGV